MKVGLVLKVGGKDTASTLGRSLNQSSSFQPITHTFFFHSTSVKASFLFFFHQICNFHDVDVCVDQWIDGSTRQAQFQAGVNTIGHSANLSKTSRGGGGGWGGGCMQTWPMKTLGGPAAPSILSL